MAFQKQVNRKIVCIRKQNRITFVARMFSYCNNFIYLDTPDFLSKALHYFGFLSVPIHLFGAYCILFKTPPRMKSVKWSLLMFHFWSCFLDVSLSFLTVPFIFIPAFAGYPLGLLNDFGVSVAVQTGVVVTTIGLVAVSIIKIFESRLLILISPYHWWRKIRSFWFIFNYTLALTFYLPTYLMIPDQQPAREQLLSLIPCVPSYVNLDSVFVLAVLTRYFLWTLIMTVCCYFAQMVGFARMSERLLKKECNRISVGAAHLQKTFQKALVLQVMNFQNQKPDQDQDIRKLGQNMGFSFFNDFFRCFKNFFSQPVQL